MVVARGARGRRCRVEARDGLDDADATIENGVVQGASAEAGCRVEACLWTSTMRTRQAARQCAAATRRWCSAPQAATCRA